MRRAFNKLGSIEIEDNTLRYRISTQELGMEEPEILIKEIKRKVHTIGKEDMFVLPMDISIMNRYMVLYYDVAHYQSIDYLREVDLETKLPFYLSLIEIAKEQEKGLLLSWDRLNFFCDRYENKVKIALFETETLKIYEDAPDLLRAVKDLICTTMTDLNKIINIPRKHDFINPSEENIVFVEKVLKMQNLDDLYMYIETLQMDMELDNSVSIDREEAKKKSSFFKKTAKKEKVVLKKEKPAEKVIVRKKKPKPNSNKKKTVQNKKDRQMKMLFIAVGVGLVLYFMAPLLTPPTGEAKDTSTVNLVSTDESGYFKGTANKDVNLVDAYRKAYNSEYDGAYTSLAKVDKKTLDLKDIPLLIQIYDETGHLAGLLDEVPNLANDVITYLLTKNKLDSLTDVAAAMETKNPYIEFETAHIKEDYETMLTLIGEVEINGRKEKQIMDGYLALERFDEARRFAEKVGNPDLIKLVEESTF